MASNSRLAMAVHTAGILALNEKVPVTSEMIATSVGTNPVVIRRIIGCLVKGGIVDVRKGAGGGSLLTRAPSDISIGDIYDALDEDHLFQVPSLGETHSCPIGRAVRPILSEIFQGAEGAVVRYLGSVTLEDLIGMIADRLPAVIDLGNCDVKN